MKGDLDRNPLMTRVRWTIAETRDFLKVLRVMKVLGFDPNDSNEWFKEERTTKLKKEIQQHKSRLSEVS